MRDSIQAIALPWVILMALLCTFASGQTDIKIGAVKLESDGLRATGTWQIKDGDRFGFWPTMVQSECVFEQPAMSEYRPIKESVVYNPIQSSGNVPRPSVQVVATKGFEITLKCEVRYALVVTRKNGKQFRSDFVDFRRKPE